MTLVRRRSGNLPAELNTFVGRTDELGVIRRLMASAPLVTLSGTGGVGKTRLALHAAVGLARSFADGVWLVEFAEVLDPTLLEQAVASSLGLQGPMDAPRELLHDHLSERSILMILDNCEHVIDGVAALTESLLTTCPGLRVLATSREPLRIPGEAVLDVSPLGVPDPRDEPTLAALAGFDAVNLFNERASAAIPGYDLTDQNRHAVARIVQQLDGLPLAIELATARLRTLSPTELADRLDHRYRLLTAGARTAPVRHQTLRTCVDWSYQQCSELEQELWRRLSVFVGGFELDAVAGVCGYGALDGEDLDELLRALVEKSIAVHTPAEGVSRYRMLESLRVYGLEHLELSGDLDEARRRHRDWFTRLVIDTRAFLLSPGQKERWRRLDRELPNLRAAFDQLVMDPADPDLSVRMAVSLQEYWMSRGMLTEARRYASLCLERPGGPQDHDRLLLLSTAGGFAAFQGDFQAASLLVAEAQRVAGQLADPLAKAHAAHAAGWVAYCMGDRRNAFESMQYAVGIIRRADDPLTLLWALIPTIVTAGSIGDIPMAQAAYEEARAISQPAGDVWFRTHCAGAFGSGLRAHGHLDEAAEVLRDSIRFGAQVDELLQCLWSLEYLSMIAAATGQHDRGAVLLGASVALAADFAVKPLGVPGHLIQRAKAEEDIKAGLGAAVFKRAFDRGRSMDYAEATAYASGDTYLATAAETAPLSAPSPLTPREDEVARWVADGLTNKEIAAKLFVTPRTVRGHIENILAKLGFASRTQIAVWHAERSSVTSNSTASS